MIKPKDLIETLERIIEMEDLLNRIYTDVGPYNQENLSDDTSRRLNNFMRFDDSE